MKQIEQYLSSFYKVTKDPNLDAMNFFMKRLGDPHLKFKSIHVSGTNGKGSVVETMNAVMVEAGFKVGVYRSPYLIEFNEYMSINGLPISDDELVELLDQLRPLVAEYQLLTGPVKMFEISTTLAFMYFAKNNIDLAIVEVGIGSEWDCTNVITPLLNLITKIDFDHTELLGETIEEIASSESGIMKEGVPTILCSTSPQKAIKIVESRAIELGARLVITNRVSRIKIDNTLLFEYDGSNYEIALKGKFQATNTALCIEAVKILADLGFAVSDTQFRKALLKVIHRARFEKISNEPLVVFDGAHNPDSMRAFSQLVKDYYGQDKRARTFVVAMLETKDVSKSMKALAKVVGRKDRVIFTSGVDRDLFHPAEYLRGSFGKYSEAMEFEDALEQVDAARINFFVGTFKTYKEVVDMWQNKK